MTDRPERPITRNQIAPLQALATFPDRTAPSARDWINAAIPLRTAIDPYLRGKFTLYKVLRSVHPLWVLRERRGHRVVARLLPRGAKIISGELPVKIHGYPELGRIRLGVDVPIDRRAWE
jgi:hypothetical protein